MSCLAQLSRQKRFLAFAGAGVHSNNTTEMSAMVETLSFLGHHGRLPVMRTRAFSITLNILLVFAWARFSFPANSRCWKSSTGCDFPCSTSTVTRRRLGNECADHAAALGAFGLVSLGHFPSSTSCSVHD